MCKHFNLPWTFLRDDIDVVDYFAMLVVAIGAEESDRHSAAVMTAIAFNDPKRLKKLQPKKHRSTTSSPGGDPTGTIAAFALSQGGFKPNGTAEEFAAATGRKVAYLKDGVLYDKEGNVTEKGPLTFIVPMPEA